VPQQEQASLASSCFTSFVQPPAHTNHTKAYGALPDLWNAAKMGHCWVPFDTPDCHLARDQAQHDRVDHQHMDGVAETGQSCPSLMLQPMGELAFHHPRESGRAAASQGVDGGKTEAAILGDGVAEIGDEGPSLVPETPGEPGPHHPSDSGRAAGSQGVGREKTEGAIIGFHSFSCLSTPENDSATIASHSYNTAEGVSITGGRNPGGGAAEPSLSLEVAKHEGCACHRGDKESAETTGFLEEGEVSNLRVATPKPGDSPSEGFHGAEGSGERAGGGGGARWEGLRGSWAEGASRGVGVAAEQLLAKLRWACLGPNFDWTQRCYLYDQPHLPLPRYTIRY
jgi:hypothetical protein